jgi:uncharacterized protein (DUF1501 family)
VLTIFSGHEERDCGGMTRRSFLCAGALGLGGLTLPTLLRARAQAREAQRSYVRDRSVVLVFLGGGPPQTETFDPKPDAPVEVRSAVGEVKTALPGVSFGGLFPRLARLADRLAVVRSFVPTTGGNHDTAIHEMLAGCEKTQGLAAKDFLARHPSLGSLTSRLRGPDLAPGGMPAYALLTAPERGGEYRNHLKWITEGAGPGPLGPAYAPFNPGQGSTLLENLELRVPAERFNDRRALLDALDRLSRSLDAGGVLEGADRFQAQAFDVIRSGLTGKLSIDDEDPRTLAAYDTSMYQVGWTNLGYRPCTLGRQLLLARRLCEAGAAFVTVQNAGWDLHGDGNNAPIVHGMQTLAPPLDKALAAFIEDVDARGLTDRILLVVTGEFGRTPKINAGGGRDHWGGICPLLLAGGGLRVGQVVGESTRHGERPQTEPVRPSNLMATVLHALFDVAELRIAQGLPREVLARVEGAEPIREVV